jgi:hypothetical protein
MPRRNRTRDPAPEDRLRVAIKSARDANCWTCANVAVLAQRAGHHITGQVVWKIENRSRVIYVDDIEAIRVVFGWSWDDVLATMEGNT